MDDDTRRLVFELCTRAGMIMEDASATALLTAELDDAALQTLIDTLGAELGRASALIAAAKSLCVGYANGADPTL